MIETREVDPKVLGRRLAEARKARGLTQQAVAEELAFSRPILIAIEKGTRKPKADEMLGFARLYGRSVHDLVRPGTPVGDVQLHLRAVADKVHADDEELARGIAELQRFAEDYCELERLMNAPMAFNYPPEVRLSGRVDVAALAEDVALQERQRLGLGDRPLPRLRSTLENDVGMRILYGSLPSHVAGMFAFASDIGCCVMINSKHPAERRRASLAHEYGHLFVDRFKPGIDLLRNAGRKAANERFAEAFAMGFLMPAGSIRRRFNEVVGATGDFQVADLCRLSRVYYVSVEAMALRLEKLGLVPTGTRDYLKESGFEVRRASELLGLPGKPERAEPLPERYRFLAVSAYEQGKISEGQLARFLRCDRVTARGVVAEVLNSNEVTDEGQYQSKHAVNLQHSLLSDAT